MIVFRAISGAGMLGSAFSPLLAVLSAIAFLRHAPIGGIACAVLAAACIVFLRWYFVTARRLTGRKRVTITKVVRKDDLVLAFTSSYLLPVTTAVLVQKDWAWVPTTSLLVIVYLVYWRSGLIYLNPVLTIIGYRVFQLERSNGAEVFLLTRSHEPPQRTTLSGLVALNNHTYVDWKI